MTEKEFSKLKRHELLQLLLVQGQEEKELGENLADLVEKFRELEESHGRLKERLDEKDIQIEHLKRRLESKDRQISDLKAMLEHERTLRGIQIEEAGSIAEAALRLNGVFETAQKAADQYLENIRLRSLNFGEESEVLIDG